MNFINRCVVYQIKDTIFWKQITTFASIHLLSEVLFIRSKIQFFESKSQQATNVTMAIKKIRNFFILFFCLDICKIYLLRKLKLQRWLRYQSTSLRYRIQNIQNKRQSHKAINEKLFCKSFFSGFFKVVQTIIFISFQIFSSNQKQRQAQPDVSLYQNIKDINFESKSQQKETESKTGNSCLSDQRYNFLKANHNENLPTGYKHKVVYQIKDTIFWKQITTN